MAAPITIDDFLLLVRKSALVSAAALNAYLHQLALAPLPTAPPALAERMVHDGIITHFQAEQFLLGKCRGMILGKYKVLERIGSGGMALVYLCEHQLMGHRAAVKVLPTNFAQNAEYLQRFYREARATAGLDHPNIVRAFDIDQDHDRHFLVMEYIEGGLLLDIVRKFGPMKVERAAHYIRQTALGLQAIHEAGMVHRDIKPDNLIVDRGGTVKILDLGLARSAQDSEEVLTCSVLGTPDYLAPEQCEDSHRVDIRADIYSLGGTLYFLLTGNPPFGQGTVAQKLRWHQTLQPRSIRVQRPDVSVELEMVAATMLAKDPDYRYQTPGEVIEALAPWTQTPIPPPAEEEMPRLSPKAQSMSDTDVNLKTTPMTPATGRRIPGSDPAFKSWGLDAQGKPKGN